MLTRLHLLPNHAFHFIRFHSFVYSHENTSKHQNNMSAATSNTFDPTQLKELQKAYVSKQKERKDHVQTAGLVGKVNTEGAVLECLYVRSLPKNTSKETYASQAFAAIPIRGFANYNDYEAYNHTDHLALPIKVWITSDDTTTAAVPGGSSNNKKKSGKGEHQFFGEQEINFTNFEPIILSTGQRAKLAEIPVGSYMVCAGVQAKSQKKLIDAQGKATEVYLNVGTVDVVNGVFPSDVVNFLVNERKLFTSHLRPSPVYVENDKSTHYDKQNPRFCITPNALQHSIMTGQPVCSFNLSGADFTSKNEQTGQIKKKISFMGEATLIEKVGQDISDAQDILSSSKTVQLFATMWDDYEVQTNMPTSFESFWQIKNLSTWNALIKQIFPVLEGYMFASNQPKYSSTLPVNASHDEYFAFGLSLNVSSFVIKHADMIASVGFQVSPSFAARMLQVSNKKLDADAIAKYWENPAGFPKTTMSPRHLNREVFSLSEFDYLHKETKDFSLGNLLRSDLVKIYVLTNRNLGYGDRQKALALSTKELEEVLEDPTPLDNTAPTPNQMIFMDNNDALELFFFAVVDREAVQAEVQPKSAITKTFSPPADGSDEGTNKRIKSSPASPQEEPEQEDEQEEEQEA